MGEQRGVLRRTVVVLCLVLATTQAFAQSSATVGSLRGEIRDKSTKGPAVGATVVATSPALVGEQTAITDETGQYFITSLSPGFYTLTIFFGATFTRSNILVRVGKESVVNVDVTSGGAGEVIEIEGDVPLVDQGSTKTGITITDDYTRNIPTGRTFADVLGAAAGSGVDQYGPTFNGTTSPENVFIIDGLDTTDTLFGGISTNLPNEFIAETEVVTGGYNAEFGRAIGGIVNVVTKQGSNKFRGSVFAYFTPGQLVAEADRLRNEGSSIEAKYDLLWEYDLGAEVGGPIVKDRLWFHVGVNPSANRLELTRTINSQRDEDQDGVPDVDPDTDFLLRDEITRLRQRRTHSTYFFTGKINGAVDQNHQFQVTAFGSPAMGAEFHGAHRNPANSQYKFTNGSLDVAAKWTSKLHGGKTQLDAVVGYHRASSFTAPNSPGGALPRAASRYDRSVFDFASLEPGDLSRCEDGANDPYPMIVNCPIPNYVWQGTGQLFDDVRDRTQVVATATRRVRALGYHTLKAGLDFGLAGFWEDRGFTGGFQTLKISPTDPQGRTGVWRIDTAYEYVRELAPDEEVELADHERICAEGRALCARVRSWKSTMTSDTYAAFIQDSWQPVPYVTINAGLRWERQTSTVADETVGNVTAFGERVGEHALELDNLLAPRFGVIFDPTREGKAKLFGHWGRYYENVPLLLNVGFFGNGYLFIDRANTRRLNPNSGAYDPNCDVDFSPGVDAASTIDQCKDRVVFNSFGDSLASVAPGLEGQYTDELVLGVEYEVVADLKVGATYLQRRLPSVIEDISISGDYVIANPGTNYDDEAAKLYARADEVEEADPGLAAMLRARAETYEASKTFDKAQRDYDAVQLTLQQRPTKKSLVQASYTYSRLRGNFSGSVATDTGQLAPNVTANLDLPEIIANRAGALKTDVPHNIKIDGFYNFELSKTSRLVAGASFRAQSGTPRNTIGSNVKYGAESFLLERGHVGRSPMTSQTDLHLSYGRILGKTLLEGFVRVFNVLDQQAEIEVDELYTYDFVNPVVGGDRSDLRHAKTIDFATGRERETTAKPNRNFLRPSARQQPRFIQFGARLTF